MKKHKSPAPPPKENDDLIEYMSFMASLIEDRKVSKADMKKSLSGWMKKWSQRPLSFWIAHYKLPSRWFKKRESG